MFKLALIVRRYIAGRVQSEGNLLLCYVFYSEEAHHQIQQIDSDSSYALDTTDTMQASKV